MENRKVEKIKKYGLLKRKSIEKYQKTLAFLYDHWKEWQTIENFIHYHDSFPLNESVLKHNGKLDAIYYFYLEDHKEESIKYQKNPTEESKKRITADQLLMNELEEIKTKYREILVAMNEKMRLEKILNAKEIEILKAPFEEKEAMKR